MLGWVVLAVVGYRRYPRWWWRWGLVVPLFVAVTVSMTWFEISGRIGWAVSRGDMHRAGVACGAGDSPPSGSSYNREKVGVYEFYDVERLPDGGCHFRLSRDYPVVRNGFVYLPNEELREGVRGHTYYLPLGDDWYFYEFTE
ncbi:hypothetical protein ACFWU5_26325 [Nocardia sp. NPDC058640]|uniref:hypothetical protein n=1 Tax=Nocardia sp. NPDC058640 TaxID=3346571 RepID=UPI0036613D2D